MNNSQKIRSKTTGRQKTYKAPTKKCIVSYKNHFNFLLSATKLPQGINAVSFPIEIL